MCCPLYQVSGELRVQAVAFKKNDKDEDVVHLKGIYDNTPKTLGDRISRYFQRLELLEKMAEIADECFHLFNSVLRRYTNPIVYQTLCNLHHGSHDIEHLLHSFCFLGDVTRLITDKFFEYRDHKRTQLNYLRTLSRICHATAHLFATAEYLHELKLCSLDKFERFFKYTALISTLGYALWTISLIWQRYQEEINEQFASDVCIHLGGCVFEGIHLVDTIDAFSSYSTILNKVGAVAGIVHAWCVVQRLMPKDTEELTAQFVKPKENGAEEDSSEEEKSSPHCNHFH
jgi:hypothetical protein